MVILRFDMMEMDLDFDSETPPSSPVLGYAVVEPSIKFSSDEYCFECKGQVRQADTSFSPQGLLTTGELISALKLVNKNTSLDTSNIGSSFLNDSQDESLTSSGASSVRFFSFPFQLSNSNEDLKVFIQMCRKSIYQLENLVQPTPVVLGGNSGDSANDSPSLDFGSNNNKPWNLRQDVCNFLNYVLRYSYLFRQSSSSEHVVADLFTGLRKSLVRVEDWRAYLKSHGGFVDGNKCTSPYYHFFHLQLELRWFFLVLSNVTAPTLDWILDDLIQLAWFKYSVGKMEGWQPRVCSKVPFNCYCVKELWTMVKHLVDEIKPLGKDFWEFVAPALNRCDKYGSDLLFPLWLVANIAPLGSYTLKGHFVPTNEPSDNGYEFVKGILQECLRSKSVNLNDVNELVYKLLPFWGADDGVIQLLWGHWSADIGKHNVQDSNYWKSPEKWLSLVKSLAHEETSSTESGDGDDFSKFIRLFCGHIKFYPKGKKIQKLVQLIYLKLPESKIIKFNEMGLIRLSSLHLGSIAAAEPGDAAVISKMFSNSYSSLYKTLWTQKKLSGVRTILTAEATMFLLLLEKSLNVSSLSSPFSDQVHPLMLLGSKLQMEPEKRELVMVYFEFVDAIPKFSPTSSEDLGQASLLPETIAIWLKFAPADYLNRTLRILHSLCQWQFSSSPSSPLLDRIYNICFQFVMSSAYRRKFTDVEPLAELAADLTYYCFRNHKGSHIRLFETYALNVNVVPELSQFYVDKVVNNSCVEGGGGGVMITDHLKLLQAWIRLICTNSVVPRRLTSEVLSENQDQGLFGFSNEGLLQLFCEQAGINESWQRKDIEDILKPLLELCKASLTQWKDNLEAIDVTVKFSRIVLSKLKFTKLYSPKVPSVASSILDFYSKFLNGLSDNEQGRIWFKHLPEVFEAIITSSYTIWDKDPYLKRQVQTLVTAAFTGFSSIDYTSRNVENHPCVKIMKSAIETDQAAVLEEMLPNLKLPPSQDQNSNPQLDYLKTLRIFTRRDVNLVPVIIYSLPGILSIVRLSGTQPELPLCTELICSVLNPSLNACLTPAVLTLKIKEAFKKELDRHLSLNYRKYFKLLSSMLASKVSFKSELKSFLKEELYPLFAEQIKLCEYQRGTGQNDSLKLALLQFEKELEN